MGAWTWVVVCVRDRREKESGEERSYCFCGYLLVYKKSIDPPRVYLYKDPKKIKNFWFQVRGENEYAWAQERGLNEWGRADSIILSKVDCELGPEGA